VRTLLFTQCLQHDFVGPLPAGVSLPNTLHIGRAESRRILGDPDGDWTREGPLARFVAAWRRGVTREQNSIHVRDWHDPDDPQTRVHLSHFGAHCLRGTPGAEFVPPLKPLTESGHVVDSAILSDFAGTDLEPRLRGLTGALPVRAAIIGVWTDFKVQYLAYELLARLGYHEIAVCSALCASRSRTHHRQALEHMSASLGVAVIDSLPEFEAWLGLAKAALVPLRGRSVPELCLPEGVELDGEESRLVLYLFRDCREVALRPLGGGFSGSRVFASESVDRGGRREVPFVVKIDSHARIARERVAVESVENLLGAASPRLADYVDLESRGAIKYHFASMHGGEVHTLQRAFRAVASPDAARALLENVIERVLTRLSQSPQPDGLALFDYYGFRPEYVAPTLERAARIAESEDADSLRIPGLPQAFPHPRRFYERLDALGREEPSEVACAWVHGDLNLANILLDATGNVWLIDYFWTRLGHALQDVAKLENDLRFVATPLADDAALRRAVDWDWLLLSQADLLAPLPELPQELAADPGLTRSHAAIAALRAFGARLLREAGFQGPVPARQYHVAQYRYAAHSLSFDECDERQKRFALAAACRLASVLP